MLSSIPKLVGFHATSVTLCSAPFPLLSEFVFGFGLFHKSFSTLLHILVVLFVPDDSSVWSDGKFCMASV